MVSLTALCIAIASHTRGAVTSDTSCDCSPSSNHFAPDRYYRLQSASQLSGLSSRISCFLSNPTDLTSVTGNLPTRFFFFFFPFFPCDPSACPARLLIGTLHILLRSCVAAQHQRAFRDRQTRCIVHTRCAPRGRRQPRRFRSASWLEKRLCLGCQNETLKLSCRR